jgi:hypothetical protein
MYTNNNLLPSFFKIIASAGCIKFMGLVTIYLRSLFLFFGCVGDLNTVTSTLLIFFQDLFGMFLFLIFNFLHNLR